MTVTVKQIIDTHKDLKRYNNYYNKHMPDCEIAQADDIISVAREAFKTAVDTFEACDVTELKPNNKPTLNRIQRLEQDLSWQKDMLVSVENEENDDPDDEWFDDWKKEEIEDVKRNIVEITEEIDELKATL